MREALLGMIFVVAMILCGWTIGRMEVNGLQEQVRTQNDRAAAKLAELTQERDDKQALLDALAADQEKKDAERLEEIERLAGELRDRPVRVRIVTQPGACGSGPAGDGAGPADPGAGSEAPAYGLLPESNSRRLAGALNEVERLSAAYNSCRARLLHDHPKEAASVH